MHPRKLSSKPAQKQDFPLDYVKMIHEVLEKNFKAFAKDKNIKIDGQIYMQEIVLNLGFKNKNGIKQVNFTASVDHDMKKKNTMNQIYLAIDALGSMLSQYVEAEEDIELPTEWTEFDFEKHKVYLKFTTNNTDLDSAADKLLGEDS